MCLAMIDKRLKHPRWVNAWKVLGKRGSGNWYLYDPSPQTISRFWAGKVITSHKGPGFHAFVSRQAARGYAGGSSLRSENVFPVRVLVDTVGRQYEGFAYVGKKLRLGHAKKSRVPYRTVLKGR